MLESTFDTLSAIFILVVPSILEDDQLDKFNLFDIKFEMLPQASKNKTIVQNS